jgi:hypothetical protein
MIAVWSETKNNWRGNGETEFRSQESEFAEREGGSEMILSGSVLSGAKSCRVQGCFIAEGVREEKHRLMARMTQAGSLCYIAPLSVERYSRLCVRRIREPTDDAMA